MSTMTEARAERQLGMKWERKPETRGPEPVGPMVSTNTVTSLWPSRWPAIALEPCIEAVEAAPMDRRGEVKRQLPCGSGGPHNPGAAEACPAATRCLNAKRKELGPLLYDREILTQPRSSESSLFPLEIWQPMKMRMPCVRHWQPPFSMEHEYKIAQSWDIAWSEKTGGDYLVNMTASVHLPTGKRRLLDVHRWQRVSFDDQIDLIEQRWRQYGADIVVIETDAAQQVWKQRVANTTPVPVASHDAGDKRGLAEGVPGLLIALDNQKWEIPWMPDGYHHEEIVNMLNEFQAFGWVNGRLEGVGEHDDTVMAFWHLSWGIDRLLKYRGGHEQHTGHVGGARP